MRKMNPRLDEFNCRNPGDVRASGIGRYWVFTTFLCCLAACGHRMDPAESLEKGRALLESGDLATAVIELKNAVQGAPDNPEARFVLGQAYLAGADADAALKELKRARRLGMIADELNRAITKTLIINGNVDVAATELALNSDDSSAEWISLQALLDLAVGRFEEARAGFERAIEMDPGNVDARRAVVRAAIGMGDTEQARKEVQAALEVTQNDFDIWLLKGDLDRHDKNYGDAREAYSKALEIIPGSPVALLGRASVRAALADSKGALADLTAIGKASNEDPRALYLRALIARQQNNLDAALRYLRQILQVIPNHRDSLAQAATIHFKLNELTRAEEYLNRLLAIDPANEEYRRMLGAVQLAAGRLNTGLGDLENADIESLSDPRMLALLGTAYLKHGKFAAGTRSLERAYELAPDSIPIRAQLAFSKMRGGKFDEALKELAAIRAEAPDFALVGVLQAFGYAAKRNEVAALAAANELIEQGPETAVVYNVRGYLYGLFGDTEKATADFKTALAKDPKFHPANLNLARLASKAGNNERAKARLQAILDQAPNQLQGLLYMASILAAEGNVDEALQLWEQARENNADAVEPRILLARHHRHNGNAVAAQNMAEEAYRLAPYAPAAQFEYAMVKMNAGEPQAAVSAIKAMVARFPDSAQAMELLARAYEQMGDAGALESTLVELTEQFPEAVKARVALAHLHLRREEFDAAGKLASELVANEKSQAIGYALQGDISFAKRAMPEALTAYRKAHDLNPSSQSLLRLYGVHQQTGGDAKLLDEWLTEYPNDVAVRVTKATADLSDGRQTDAIAQYEKVLELQPHNIIALNNLAWIFDELDDERAGDYARRAYDAAPTRAEIADTYGWIMLRKGNHEQAVDLLTKAIEAAPENPEIRYHFASALAKAGEHSSAVRELESILKTDRVFPSRAEAATLLRDLQQ